VLFLSLQAQAFWFTVSGGVSGAWAGVQLGQLVQRADAYTAQQEQAVAQGIPTYALPTPPAVALPIAVAQASDLYTPTPRPTPTVRPTQTPRPIPPGPQPDRLPAVSPFVFARR